VINNCFLARKRCLSLPAEHAKLVSFVVFEVLVFVSVALGIDFSLHYHKMQWVSTSDSIRRSLSRLF